jgi:hypothetical protein
VQSTSSRLRAYLQGVRSFCRKSDRVGANGDPSSAGASASRRAWMPCPDSGGNFALLRSFHRPTEVPPGMDLASERIELPLTKSVKI